MDTPQVAGFSRSFMLTSSMTLQKTRHKSCWISSYGSSAPHSSLGGESGSSFHRSSAQSGNCLTCSFKNTRVGLGSVRPFLITFWLFRLQGASARIQKPGWFGNKSKPDTKCPMCTRTFRLSLPSPRSHEMFCPSLSSLDLEPVCTRILLEKVLWVFWGFFFMAVLFYGVQGLCFHQEHYSLLLLS